MYFYRDGKNQILDLKGDLIISFNDALVKVRSKSAGPKIIKSPDGYILNVGKAGFFKRIRVTLQLISFVWGHDKELTEDKTNLNKPFVKEQPVDFPARCEYLHLNKGYCIHANNLDNDCLGYDNCKDYEVESVDNGRPDTPPKPPVKPVG